MSAPGLPGTSSSLNLNWMWQCWSWPGTSGSLPRSGSGVQANNVTNNVQVLQICLPYLPATKAKGLWRSGGQDYAKAKVGLFPGGSGCRYCRKMISRAMRAKRRLYQGGET